LFVQTFVRTICYDGGMPKEPMEKVSLRVPRALWKRAKVRADERGENVSEAVRKFLERYTR
jgi:hypothetical protein